GGASPMGASSDPLALSPLADPLLQPNTAQSGDPFASLQVAASPAPRAAASRSDHLPIDQFAFTPPKAVGAPDFSSLLDDLAPAPSAALGPEPQVASAPAAAVASPAPPIAAAAAPAFAADPLYAAFLRG